MFELQEIDRYLLKECPDEFRKLPDKDQFTFINTPRQFDNGDVGDKRPQWISHVQLCLRVSDGEYTPGLPVHLCLGGTGYIEIFLSCKARLYKLTVENLSHVLLDQAYRNLLLSEGDTRAAEEVEKGRLKAWACYSFLRAGHIRFLHPYPRFQDELRYACTWITRENGVKVKTARQKAALQRKKEENVESKLVAQESGASSATGYYSEGRADFQSRAATSGTRAQSSKAIEQPRQSAVKRKTDDDDSNDVPPRPSKKRNIDQTFANLRHGYEAFGQHLDALERGYADLGNDTDTVRQLEHANSQHVAKISKLERQLQIQVAKTGEMQAVSGMMQERLRVAEEDLDKIRKESAVSAIAAEAEKTAREEEARLRKQAETRLADYLEAHKKMAAMFG